MTPPDPVGWAYLIGYGGFLALVVAYFGWTYVEAWWGARQFRKRSAR